MLRSSMKEPKVELRLLYQERKQQCIPATNEGQGGGETSSRSKGGSVTSGDLSSQRT